MLVLLIEWGRMLSETPQVPWLEQFNLDWSGKRSMEREASNPGILKRYRYPILALMAIASLSSAVLRFSGDWSHFWAVLAVQAWFIQAAFAYLREGRIAIGPGRLSRDAGLLGRLALAATAFAA
ncbi:hypothetical protein [Pseudomonas lutea]|jgi:hypothetical protein|uniref:hypothetical protein n=1 Tax=Pseudomonas lutea TaxID=243924 RepID=UPI001FD492F2|nr:hypothetical protein [Pseudomonas lutea]